MGDYFDTRNMIMIKMAIKAPRRHFLEDFFCYVE